MKIERSRNALRNMKYSLVNKLVELLGPFVVRTVFIRSLGGEYLGVNSLFTSILSVLSLTELGFSSAIVYSMYKAIGDDETQTINALMAYYRKVYHCVGFVILTIGLLILPFLPQLVKGSYPGGISPYIVYLIFLGNTVISYFMYAYRGAIITAFQRDDLVQKINITIRLAMYIMQIAALEYFKNYYVYILIMPIFTAISNIRTATISKRFFPEYVPQGDLRSELKLDIKEKVGGLVVFKFGDVSRNSFDSICISMYMGLSQIALYNNHYYIMQSVTAVLQILIGSISAGVGNSIATESERKNYDDMVKLDFLYMRLTGWCTCCLLCLYEPFMRIWLGDTYTFPVGIIILFCIYFYSTKINNIAMIYYTANGFWWQGRKWALLEAAANIILNFLLGKLIGIYGILLATIITICGINYVANARILFKNYFKQEKISEFFLYHGKYAVVTLIVCALTYYMTTFTQRLEAVLVQFILNGLICLLVPNLMFKIVYSRTTIYKESLVWLSLRITSRIRSLIFLIW